MFMILKRIHDLLSIPFPLSSKSIHFERTLKTSLFNLLIKSFNYKVSAQTKIINSRKWDNLIILDACRYDFFEQLIWNFLDGELFPVLSSGSNTIQWLKNTWYRLYKDIVYFSANPYINSKKCIKGFCAKRRFNRVVDVWDIGWSNVLGTVPPQNMNVIIKKFLFIYKLKLKLGRDVEKPRIVMHYVQPHSPYITLSKKFNKIIKEFSEAYNISYETVYLILFKHLFGSEYKVNEFMKKLYITNLRVVLKHVAELIPYLDGVTIISSDHGELLGEYGMYFHQTDAPLPYLRIVPLFIVK